MGTGYALLALCIGVGIALGAPESGQRGKVARGRSRAPPAPLDCWAIIMDRAPIAQWLALPGKGFL
ncbi:MAG: hypothetical protein DMG80_01075 [Acidobacteria bacterium]|nr:MAG: hypothetical protein DMG80_01075 [Acidobacteriota bacterium]